MGEGVAILYSAVYTERYARIKMVLNSVMRRLSGILKWGKISIFGGV